MFDPVEDRRRLHQILMMASVLEVDYEKMKFRAKRDDIESNWLSIPA